MKSAISKPRALLIAIIFLGAILRIPYLTKFPPSLYSDEVSQGYNAYSILKTSKDEHGTFLPVSIRAFGEWKPPLQTYLMIPTIYVFGLNAWGVRLPSAVLGTVTILLVYLLGKELVIHFSNGSENRHKFFLKHREEISLLSALFLAISSWHILQSRAAMHGALAIFFISLAILSFLKSIKDGRFLLLSSISFVASIYTYYGFQLSALLIVCVLGWFFRKQLFFQRKFLIISLSLGFILLTPLVLGFIKEPDIVFGRARFVSVFYDQGIPLTVWSLITQDGAQTPPLLAQFFHNKPYHYLIDITRRFFEHFGGNFLFLVGDRHPPFQIPGMGILYLTDGFALLVGFLLLIQKKVNLLNFMLWWIFISILPSSLTFLTPSTHRPFMTVLPFMFIIAIGATAIIATFRKISFTLPLCVFYGISILYFLVQYFVILPVSHADWWYYGYEEMMIYLKSQEKYYDHIVVSGKVGVPYIFLLFYQGIDPVEVGSNISRNFTKDNFGFEHVDAFGKYSFPRFFEWKSYENNLSPNTLLVVRADEKAGDSLAVDRLILYPDGKIAYKILKID